MTVARLALLLSVTLSVVLAGPPCNPAIHCAPQAVECTECNPSIDSSCSYEMAYNQGPGMCTNYQRPNRQSGVPDFNDIITLSLKQRVLRCISVMDVTGEDHVSQVYKYIASCPEGYFTCFDGFCTKVANKCYNRCRASTACKKKNGKYQLRPVRFSDERCAEDCRNPRTITDECTIDGMDDEDLTSQIPEIIPIPSTDCCQRDEPEVYTIVLGHYTAGSCCPYIPDGEIISAGLFPDTDPTYRIFNVPIDTYVNDVTGLELQNVQVLNLEYNEEMADECCCSLKCSCYGDPHCNAFDMTQRSSLTPGLEFNMFREGPASNEGVNYNSFTLLNVTNGERGVASKITLKFRDNNNFLWELEAAQAHGNCWARVPINGGPSTYPTQANLPHELTDNFIGPGVISCPTAPLPPPVVFLASNEIYTDGTNIQYNAQNVPGTDYSRFDINLDRYVHKKDECCAAPDILIDEIEAAQTQRIHKGFCYEPNSPEADQAFQGFPTRRVLQTTTPANANIDQKEVDNFCYKQYCKKSKNSNCVQNCLNLAYDFGVDALKQELNSGGPVAMPAMCHEAGDDIFRTPLGDCVPGLMLQATLKGQDNWQLVRAWPTDTMFCNDILEIPFQPPDQLRFTYNANNNRLLTYEQFDIRFVERIDVPAQCNPCQTKSTVSSFQLNLNVFRDTEAIGDIECQAPDTCIPCSDISRRLLSDAA